MDGLWTALCFPGPFATIDGDSVVGFRRNKWYPMAQDTRTPVGPGLAALLKCFLRCYAVGAAFNTRGLQNVGLAFAMEPGLRAIYTDDDALGRVWERYLKIYNTHPFWTPLLVGMFLSLEVRIAKGALPENTLENVKSTTAFTLSAIGDSFFSAGFMGLWALVAACFVAAGRYDAAFAYAAALFVGAQLFKLVTFFMGYREGFKVLVRVKRWDLINWGRRVKIISAALLVLFWITARPHLGDGRAFPWVDLTLVLGLAVWAAMRPRMFREPAFVLLVACGLYLAWIRV